MRREVVRLCGQRLAQGVAGCCSAAAASKPRRRVAGAASHLQSALCGRQPSPRRAVAAESGRERVDQTIQLVFVGRGVDPILEHLGPRGRAEGRRPRARNQPIGALRASRQDPTENLQVGFGYARSPRSCCYGCVDPRQTSVARMSTNLCGGLSMAHSW